MFCLRGGTISAIKITKIGTSTAFKQPGFFSIGGSITSHKSVDGGLVDPHGFFRWRCFYLLVQIRTSKRCPKLTETRIFLCFGVKTESPCLKLEWEIVRVLMVCISLCRHILLYISSNHLSVPCTENEASFWCFISACPWFVDQDRLLWPPFDALHMSFIELHSSLSKISRPGYMILCAYNIECNRRAVCT